MEKIGKSYDITFVIQGKIFPHINTQISGIKEYFPHAEVIISTCNKSDYEIIGANRIIENQDPGFFYYSSKPGEKINNVNRQIVTTLFGLREVKTKYAFKLRSDFLINGSDFLDFFNSFEKSSEEYKVFNRKVLSCCYFARNPEHKIPFPFHPSDIAFFGLTEDLINLFDIPLMTKEDAAWDTSNAQFNRYTPEQHLFINCLKKNGKDIKCHYYNNVSRYNNIETERYFASNFIFLTFEQFNLVPLKKIFSKQIHPNAFRSCFTHIEWQHLYKKHVDPTVIIPDVDMERIGIEKLYKNYRKYRFLSNVISWFFFHDKAKRRKIRNFILEYFLANKNV